MSLQENVNAIYKYMRVLSTRRVNPLIIPPDSLQMVLAQAKRRHEKGTLDLLCQRIQNINIWNYYSIMKVTPIIMEKLSFWLFLTIPLADQSSCNEFCIKFINCRLSIQHCMYNLSTNWKVNTWQSQKDKQYAALPTA